MIDPNFWHFVGGGIAAIIVLLFDRWCIFGTRLAIAILAGIAVNAVWELVVDVFHWIPWHAATYDVMDIGRGAIGAMIVVIIVAVWVGNKPEFRRM